MVGEKLMKLRKKRGMSQQEVASALGVTRQTVSNWECDQGAPSLDKAADLARLYGCLLYTSSAFPTVSSTRLHRSSSSISSQTI